MNVFFSALIGIFIQNSIFERAIGTNILLYAARKKENIIGIFLGIIYITTVSSVITYFLDRYFSENEYNNIFMPLLYITVVAAVYILMLVTIWRFFPVFFKYIKKYVHLAVFNCAVLGAIYLQSTVGSDIGSYIGYGIGTGVGFMAAAYLLYAANERLNSELVPKAFRGMPIMIVYIGVISLALSAFLGYSGTGSV